VEFCCELASYLGRGIKFAKKRLKRYGAAKALDEVLFYIIYHTFFANRNRT
jgi:hypothetical protein